MSICPKCGKFGLYLVNPYDKDGGYRCDKCGFETFDPHAPVKKGLDVFLQ